jgi:hypothetical protein
MVKIDEDFMLEERESQMSLNIDDLLANELPNSQSQHQSQTSMFPFKTRLS